MDGILAQNGDLVVVRNSRGWGELHPQPSPESVQEYYGKLDAEYSTPDGMAWLMKEKREHMVGLWDSCYCWQRRLIQQEGQSPWCLVDVGAGAGWFVDWWRDYVGKSWGVEPSETARAAILHLTMNKQLWSSAEELRLEIATRYNMIVEHAAVRFSLVLEHVPDPAGFLSDHLAWPGLDAKKVLVVVPNEFNPLQRAVLRRDPLGTFRDVPLGPVHHHRRAWFVDRRHLNYFDPPGLRACFEDAGLRVTYEGATFPMELFILAGADYRKNKSIGLAAHRLRLRFEKAMGSLAWRIYEMLYRRWGVGRELVFMGEPK